MYGCYNSHLFYGFCEGNSYYVLDSEWLYEQEKDVIKIAGINVVRNHMGEACYGVYCEINDNTGKIEVDDNNKNIIEAFYKRFMEYKKKNDDNYDEEDEDAPQLGYYNVIIGDYGMEQETYNLDEDKDE